MAVGRIEVRNPRSASVGAPRHRRSTAARPAGRPTEAPQGHQRMHEGAWSLFDAVALLDPPERRRSQDPDRLWRRVGLKAGETVVDVGAGTGFFSFPAAAIVGPTGRVYAIDVSRELVEWTRERATSLGVPNIQSVLSTPTHIPLEDAVGDVAILANVLHGIPSETVDETVRLLRPGGRLVNVDWKKRPTHGGPPLKHRLTLSEATAALTAHGLSRVDSFELGPTHYVLVFERPRPPRLPGHLVSDE